MRRRLLLAASLLAAALGAQQAGAAPAACAPTRSDQLGPFYVPGAPVRAKIGAGHLLTGVVKSTDCAPIAGARVEVWQAGPNARYDPAHRATIFANSAGRYRLESNFPPPYSGRPSHIHVRVSARGYRTLVTQFYPRAGETRGSFDIVLSSAS